MNYHNKFYIGSIVYWCVIPWKELSHFGWLKCMVIENINNEGEYYKCKVFEFKKIKWWFKFYWQWPFIWKTNIIIPSVALNSYNDAVQKRLKYIPMHGIEYPEIENP